MEIVDFLLEPFRSGLGRRALAEVALLSLVAGALSFWVASFRLAYATESLAHGLLPGLVLAAIAGAPLLGGAAAGAVAASALVALAARDERIGPDAGTSVAVTGLLGLGAMLALLPDTAQPLDDLLFGDPLGVSDGDLIAAGALAATVVPALALLHRPLAAVAFDRDGARALGLPSGLVLLALALLLGASLAVAVQGLGNLLVLALAVAPAVAVRRHARRPAAAMAAGAAVAVVAGVAGIVVSFGVGGAAGATVGLALCAAAALGSLSPPARARARGGSRSAPRLPRSSPG